MPKYVPGYRGLLLILSLPSDFNESVRRIDSSESNPSVLSPGLASSLLMICYVRLALFKSWLARAIKRVIVFVSSWNLLRRSFGRAAKSAAMPWSGMLLADR